MPKKGSPKKKDKALGKEVASLQKRVHSLKIKRDVRAYTGGNGALANIPRPIADRLLPHIPTNYSPNEVLAPLSRLRGKVSEQGLRWAIEHLDPCGVPFTSPGVPDYSTGTRHVKTTRFGAAIPPPAGIAEEATWDLLIMTLPYTDTPFFHYKKLSTEPWPVLDSLDSMQVFMQSFLIDSRPSQGDAESKATFWALPEYQNNNKIADQYSAVRPISRGLTTEIIGPNLFKGGRVYSGQFMPNFLNPVADAPVLNFSGAQTDPYPGRKTALYLPPLGPQYLVEGDPLYQERDAMCGDYNVTRTHSVTGVCPMQSTSSISAVCFGSEYLAIASPAGFQEPNSVVFWLAGGEPMVSMPAMGLNTSIVYYTDLNATQSVRFKYRGSVEGVPRLSGPYAELGKVAIEADPAAVQLVADIVNTLPHSYPADYNDLGGLMGVLGSILKHAGMPLLQGIGAAGIPVLSPVVSILHGIGQSVFGL